MNISVETSVTGAAVVATSITFSITLASSNALFVGSGTSEAQPFSVSSCTHDGIAMTELWDTFVSGSTSQTTSGHILENPNSGARNVVLTWSGTTGGGGVAGGVGIENFKSYRSVATNTGDSSSAISVTVPDSVVGDLVIDSASGFGTTIAVGGGQTSRAEDDSVAGSSWSWGISTEPATGANTVMSWTLGSSTGSWVTGAIALVPKPDRPPTTVSPIALGSSHEEDAFPSELKSSAWFRTPAGLLVPHGV